MNNTLDKVMLSELIPPNLKGDPDIVAMGAAIDTIFFANVPKIKNSYTVADIDSASSGVVDLIAAERNADFYEQSLPLDNRRVLAKHAYLFKRLKGTPYAVRKIILDVLSLYPN
jgi:P2-related tail formation protein